MAGDNTTKIIIELDLQIQNLKKQNKVVLQELEKLRVKTSTVQKGQKGSAKEHVTGVEQSTKGIKRQTDALAQQERTRAKNARNAHKDLDEHKKKLTWFGKFMSTPGGKFLGAFAMGSGVGALGGFRRGGGTATWAGSMLGRGVSRAAGGLLGFGISGLTQAYQTRVQIGLAQAGLVGMGGTRRSFGQRGRTTGPGGSALGFDPIMTAGHAQMVGRATGSINAVNYAQQAGRATGMDVGEAAGFMGQLRQAGYGFGGAAKGGGVTNEGPAQLQKVLALGMEAGLERARVPEFLQGIGAITQAVGSQISGVVNVARISAFQSVLGRSGVPGFQGHRGAAVTSKLNQSILRPGGGEAGQAIMLQALGFGKPGGTTDYYSALKQQQKGIDDPSNVAAMFKEVYSQFGQLGVGGATGNNQNANIVLSEMTGLGLQQVEDLGKIVDSGMSVEEQMKAINELTKGEKSIAEQSLEAMKEFGGEAKHAAGKMERIASASENSYKIFREIERVQVHMLKWIDGQLPAVVKWLKEIYTLIKSAVQVLSPKKTIRDELEAEIKNEEDRFAKRSSKIMLTGDPRRRADLLQEQANALRKTAGKYNAIRADAQKDLDLQSGWSLQSLINTFNDPSIRGAMVQARNNQQAADAVARVIDIVAANTRIEASGLTATERSQANTPANQIATGLASPSASQGLAAAAGGGIVVVGPEAVKAALDALKRTADNTDPKRKRPTKNAAAVE